MKTENRKKTEKSYALLQKCLGPFLILNYAVSQSGNLSGGTHQHVHIAAEKGGSVK